MTQDLYPTGEYKASALLNQPMQNLLELFDETKTADQYNTRAWRRHDWCDRL